MPDEDPLDELARLLRSGAGAEMRAEAEAVELETHLMRLRRRSVADVAREAMHRGDRLTVMARGHTFSGDPVFVGKDYMVIETTTEIYDVRLDRVALAVTRRTEGGHSVRGGSVTFRARLAEYEQTGETVRLVASGIPHELDGRILVVATDHVVVGSSDGEQVVALGALDLIIRPRPPTR